jgi:23S rRNA pseudouridine2605 synthase
MRINKYISHNSKYSRRDADKLIESNFVKVNKKPLTDLAYQVQDGDKVFVKDVLIKSKGEFFFTMLIYNKPKGELVTKRDDRGRKTIYHSLPTRFRHFVPIGRLDYASEGLLLLTDNPKVADIISNSNLSRVYNIKISGALTAPIEEGMKSGIEIKDSTVGAHKNTKITSMTISPFNFYKVLKNQADYSRVRVGISEGQNRELRRFFGFYNREVVDLRRVAFGDIELNNLPTGKHRFLSTKEYEEIKNFMFKEIKKSTAK